MLNPSLESPLYLRYGHGRPDNSAVVTSREALSSFLEGRKNANVYFNANRVAASCSKRFPGNADIERRIMLTIDIDPVRPKGTVASEQQREEIAAFAENVIWSLEHFNWGWPSIVDTGNGQQIHYETDLPVDPATNELVEELFRTLAKAFDTDTITIDPTAARLAQPMRVPGSYNVKAEPHRPCRLVRRWDSWVDLEDIKSAIEGLGGTIPGSADPMVIAQSVARYLNAHGHQTNISDGGDKIKIDIVGPCPFKKDADQTDGNPAVLIYKSSNGIGFKCNHAKCDGKGWDALQKTLPQTYAQWLHEPERVGTDEYEVTDPEVTVDRFRRQNEIISLDGDFYAYRDGWEETSRKEIAAGLTLQARDVFAEYHQRNVAKGNKQRRPTTSSRHTGDCVNLLTALCTVEGSSQGFYRVEHPWDAKHVRRFTNFDVNVDAFISGAEDYFEPASPDFFTLQSAHCAFDPAAGQPNHYLEFLKSLDWSQEEIEYFQRVSGYAIFFPRNLQKIILACGPPRAGKGVETRLNNQIIGTSSICSMTLEQFGSQFGLEDAIGKRLIQVNEASPPSPRVAEQAIATMKAISGADRVPVDRKGIKKISCDIESVLHLNTNHRISLFDASGGLASRILPLEYRKSFLNKEDHDLERKLLAELAAIAKWKLEGCRMLAENAWDFAIPRSFQGMLEEFAHIASPMRAFVDEYFVVRRGYCVSHETVLGYFRDYSENDLQKGKLISAVKEVDTLIRDGRLSNADASECKGCQFVATEHDEKRLKRGDGRPFLLLNLQPKAR